MRNPVKAGERVYLRPLEPADARASGRVPASAIALAGRLTADLHREGVYEDALVLDITRADWERARRGDT